MGLVTCECVYVWVLHMWVCVGVGFVTCGCLYVRLFNAWVCVL